MEDKLWNGRQGTEWTAAEFKVTNVKLQIPGRDQNGTRQS